MHMDEKGYIIQLLNGLSRGWNLLADYYSERDVIT